VQWIGASTPPLEVVTHLRARGLTLTTKVAGNAMEAARLGIIEAPTNALVRAPSLAGRRIAILLPDPGAADALAQALREKGAEVAALGLDPHALERVQSLDPDALLVETADFFGSCWEIVRAVWQHARLRYATVLLASPTPTGPDGSSTLDIPAMCLAVQTVSTDYDRLREKLANLTDLEFGLEAFGPARTLRALLEAKRAMRARFSCNDLTIEVDLVDEIIVGAQGGNGAQANDTLLGPHALAELMHRHEGTVSVRAVDHPSVTNIMAPLETALHVARQTLLPSRASGVRFRPASVPAPQSASIEAPRQGFGVAVPRTGVDTEARKPVTVSHVQRTPALAKSPTSQGGTYPPVTADLPRAKLEPPKSAPSNLESPKIELPKFEPARSESTKFSPKRPTPPKPAAPKLESTKLETPQAKPAEVASPKLPATKLPTPKVPTPLLHTPKLETPKLEPVKAARMVTPKPGLAPFMQAEFHAELAPRATAPTGSIPITEIAQSIPETSRVGSGVNSASLPPTVASDEDTEPATTKTASLEASPPRATGPALLRAPSVTSLEPTERMAHANPYAEGAEVGAALIAPTHSLSARKARRRLLFAVPMTLAALWLGAAAVGLPHGVQRSRSDGRAKATELRPPSTPQPQAQAHVPPVVAATLATPKPSALEEADRTSSESDDSRRARAQRASTLVGEGHSFRKGGLLPTARQRYVEALREWPGYPRALSGLAQLALLEGDEAQAVSHARQLVKVRPGQLEYRVLLGDAYHRAGLVSQARDVWQFAAKRGSRTARQRLQP